jgi:hypothetical protein
VLVFVCLSGRYMRFGFGRGRRVRVLGLFYMTMDCVLHDEVFCILDYDR